MESNVKNKKQQAMPKSEAESFGIKRNPAADSGSQELV